jgi:hypothetical protein
MIIGNQQISPWIIRHNNEPQCPLCHLGHCHYSNPMKDRDTCHLSSLEALIEVNLNSNEPQTLKDKYSHANKILYAKYKQSSAMLDDVIKTFENLHVEEQHLLEVLIQNMNIFLMENEENSTWDQLFSN